jgi:N-6 DNA Methylase
MTAADRFKPLLDREFLKGELYTEYAAWSDAADAALHERLNGWATREVTRETQAEASFVQRFFVETWGYRDDGIGADSFQLYPKFPIRGAGQGGNQGEADLGVGVFGGARPLVPQIVCEFKGIGTGLDFAQSRKGNNRSPVDQAKDYLWGARRGINPGDPVQPRYAIVTDMNEFRLYWWETFPDRYVKFRISGHDLFSPVTLLGSDDAARFDRFLFATLFRPETLLSDSGRPRLERLVQQQGSASVKLEDRFYADYRAYRQLLIDAITVARPDGVTKGGAVRLAQKLLDRLIFVMFAEDMGGRVGFPTKELCQQLRRFAGDKLLEPEGGEVWTRLKLIFGRMNTGGNLGDATIHRFNGGLFADDAQIDALALPNRIFVRFGQAQNQATTAEHRTTLFYLADTYDFAAEGDAKNAIGLYTLGHIFEQSIVELEKLEADAEGRPSLTDVTKRKRDGVFYTPEWAVQRIVEETVDPIFATWRADAAGDAAYWERLQTIRIVDPACGSGAFLITALRHLRAEFERAATAAGATQAAIARLTETILEHNLYGVDINPASVEIAKLSLWLHTAQPDTPLSSLDHTIRCGNSLIDDRFYDGRSHCDADARERINAFDWDASFPEVMGQGGFDAVVGNPPYVKLQNFRQVNADMANWLVGTRQGDIRDGPYESTRTGNYDLYLPFVEKGLELLNDGGRLGYIAPNLWPTLDYGAGLRALIHRGRHLERWIDFRSHQVFEEATVYTAIQIYTKAPSAAIALAFAGDGDISRIDWSAPDGVLPYAEIADPAQPWLFAPQPVRRLVERLAREATRLDDPVNTQAIFQGIITSADHIYHLKRAARDRYVHVPQERRLVKGKWKTVKGAPVEVAIEDALMKPLVSGEEAKRFIAPATDTYLLFPYATGQGAAALFSPARMAAEFPKAWAYLKSSETDLRGREKGKMDHEKWYGYVYPKNLDKQEVPKLIVPRLVARLQCYADPDGRDYCDNVDVGGIVPTEGSLWYLTAILNSGVSNLLFSWLSKPFRGSYMSANKQFIAPLPIPDATPNSARRSPRWRRRCRRASPNARRSAPTSPSGSHACRGGDNRSTGCCPKCAQFR